MDKIEEKINKLSLPATILIASIILGGAFYATQVNKQQSIEKQQQIELKAKAEADQAKTKAEDMRQLDLSFCLSKADTDYWAYMKINGTEKADGTIYALNSFWDRAEKNKQNAIDNCYKQYK